MSHDLYASWAAAELASSLSSNPRNCFTNPSQFGQFSIFANRESGRVWPIPDGRLSIDSSNNKYEIAIELKRTNEGLHGILTAIGQSQAYLHKGYSGSLIIIPEKYDSYQTPGEYVGRIIDSVREDLPIGVFSYQPPDSSKTSPFHQKIICHRPVKLTRERLVQPGNFLNNEKSKTQWAHLREGSSEPDAFFRYLQIAKKLSIAGNLPLNINLPAPLISACQRLEPSRDPAKYLSNSVDDIFHDEVWRRFWFKYIFDAENAILFDSQGSTYTVHDAYLGLRKDDGSGGFKKFWSSRTDSIKNTLVAELNSGSINEDEAWEKFAQNVRKRAHSYREDIDSGLEHLGFIDSDGKPSELGYRYVDACERTGRVDIGLPKMILGTAILQNGNFAAFLHYIYKVSENAFKRDPIKFTSHGRGNRLVFNQRAYLTYIREKLSGELKVMNTSAERGGASRTPFQGEFAILRKFEFINNFRLGVGLEINWPLVQEYLDFKL